MNLAKVAHITASVATGDKVILGKIDRGRRPWDINFSAANKRYDYDL